MFMEHQFAAETLRKYPPKQVISRFCTKPFRMPRTKYAMIRADTPIFISVLGIHHDKQYYENPLAFNPDRFLEKPDGKYDFLPFGAGPKKCLGYPLALLIIKSTLATIVDEFAVKSETGRKIQFDLPGYLTEASRLKIGLRRRRWPARPRRPSERDV